MAKKKNTIKSSNKNSNTKKPRARSKVEKQKQFQRIIDAAKELYVSKGWQRFGMRALARKLEMSEGNLYNYVKSKRELWIAIRAQYFKEFSSQLNEIIEKFKGKISYIDLFLKIGEFYLDFAAEDRPRFLMINVISAPESKEIGPIEKSYRTFDIMKIIETLIKEAIDAGEIKADEGDADKLSYYVYGLGYGAAKVEHELKLKDPILEPIISGSKVLEVEDFRNFFLDEIRKILGTHKWN